MQALRNVHNHYAVKPVMSCASFNQLVDQADGAVKTDAPPLHRNTGHLRSFGGPLIDATSPKLTQHRIDRS